MAIDTVITQFVQRGVRGLESDLTAIGRSFDTVEGKAARMERISERLMGLGAAGAGAMALIGAGSIKAKGQMQLAEIAFKKSSGSAEAAARQMQELRDFDRDSPLNFQETVRGAQRLRAVGFEASELKSVLTDLGDATVGTGGNSDDFMGIGRAIGQMRNKGRVSMEEINQLADRNIPALQILQKQLQLTDEQLFDLMSGDLTIKADDAIPALLKGFRELYGGVMKEGMKTLPGQVSNLNSAVFQLGETLGGLDVTAAGNLIESLTKLTDKTNEFVKANPTAAKAILWTAGLTAGGAILGGAAMKGVRAYKDVADVLDKAKSGKDRLTKSTLADNAAELLKAKTAGTEANALKTVGETAIELAGNKAKLGEETVKTAQKMGLLAKVKNLLGTGIFTLGSQKEALFKSSMNYAAEVAANQKVIPNALPGMSVNTLSRETQALARYSMLENGMAGPSGLWDKLGVQGGRTIGQVGMGAAVGAAAGYAAYDSLSNDQSQAAMRAMGVNISDTGAGAIGGGLGLGVAALTIMAPQAVLPVAAAVAIGEAIKYAAEKLYIEPMEKAAEQGTGVDNDTNKDLQDKLKTANQNKDRQAQADIYNEMAARAYANNDVATAENFRWQALSFKKLAKKEREVGSPEYAEAQKRRADDWVAKNYKSETAAELRRRYNATQGAPPQAKGRAQRRNGRVQIRFDDVEIDDPGAGYDDDLVASAYG